VQRVLVTGMSGTGKSTVIAERAARGYKAIDTDDDDWHAWVTVTGEPDRVWLESDVGVAQVGGTSAGAGKVHSPA
jgi:predicted ATPase